MTFYEYISMARVITDDPSGDFCWDAVEDRDFPVDVSTFEALESYLRTSVLPCGLDPDALEAARTVWREYEAWSK